MHIYIRTATIYIYIYVYRPCRASTMHLGIRAFPEGSNSWQAGKRSWTSCHSMDILWIGGIPHWRWTKNLYSKKVPLLTIFTLHSFPPIFSTVNRGTEIVPYSWKYRNYVIPCYHPNQPVGEQALPALARALRSERLAVKAAQMNPKLLRVSVPWKN